jgi:hypothetical protein
VLRRYDCGMRSTRRWRICLRRHALPTLTFGNLETREWNGRCECRKKPERVAFWFSLRGAVLFGLLMAVRGEVSSVLARAAIAAIAFALGAGALVYFVRRGG